VALAEALALVAVGLVRPAAARQLEDVERRLANSLLRARIPPLAAHDEGHVGTAAGVLLVRLPAALAAAVVACVPLTLTVGFFALGLAGIAGEGERYLGPWPLEPALGAVLIGLALAATLVTVAVVGSLASPLRRLARRALLRATSDGAAVREALAERIGDESLAIAYWLPERDAYVDEYGHPVELPGDDPARTCTVVEHDGRRVAVIVHDAELDARPELVRAAAAGSVLALENERLKAALRARVEELRASRTRIVEASIDARRRLERDLHDGAQQQLVSLSLELQMIRKQLDGPPGERLDGAIATLATALAELRELARGIHPSALTQRGLAAAVSVLAERSRVEVDLDLELEPEARLTPAAEAAAYFVVSEALANVAKYSGATRATVRVRREPDAVTVEVVDRGVGGAEPSRGSGLRGLADRVAALEGELRVTSPAGEGTTVFARVPAEPV
jgi:signal transduction histidine kinase